MNKVKLALINRPWKCKKGKDRRSPLVHSRKSAEHTVNMTISPALFPAVTVTVVRDRKIRNPLRTNQIAGFVTVPSWKKINSDICLQAFCLSENCSLPGMYNIRGQRSERIFVQSEAVRIIFLFTASEDSPCLL